MLGLRGARGRSLSIHAHASPAEQMPNKKVECENRIPLFLKIRRDNDQKTTPNVLPVVPGLARAQKLEAQHSSQAKQAGAE